MTTEQGGVFDLASYNDIEGKAAGTERQDTVQVGTLDNPLIVKLAFDPRWGNRATFLETAYHTYFSQYSNDPKSKRRLLCRKNFGDKCPICDAYFAMWRANSDAIKAGKAANPAFKEPMELYKGSNRAWIIVVQPNSDSVRAMNIPFSLQRILFGGMDKGTAVKGLVTEMREKARSPFDLKNTKGWIKMWKTGEGLGTTYFATEASESVIENLEGEEVERRRYFSASVGQKIFSLTLADIPVALDLEHDNAKWTQAEVARYIETDGAERPARVMMQVSGNGAATAHNTAPAADQGFAKVADFETPPWAQQAEEIPFAPTPEAIAPIKPIPHLESVIAKPAAVAPTVQQKAPAQAPKPRKVIDELDDLA